MCYEITQHVFLLCIQPTWFSTSINVFLKTEHVFCHVYNPRFYACNPKNCSLCACNLMNYSFCACNPKSCSLCACNSKKLACKAVAVVHVDFAWGCGKGGPVTNQLAELSKTFTTASTDLRGWIQSKIFLKTFCPCSGIATT